MFAGHPPSFVVDDIEYRWTGGTWYPEPMFNIKDDHDDEDECFFCEYDIGPDSASWPTPIEGNDLDKLEYCDN